MAKILVADDNSNIQKMVGLALKDQGIDVVAVGNGEAAVRKLADVKPDLVLADVFMPVRNGYEVCDYVKKDAAFAHIPVILLVGAFDPLDEQEAQRVGADGVLKKPFVPPDPLIAMVKSALARAGVAIGGAAPATEKPAETSRSAADLLNAARASRMAAHLAASAPEPEADEPAEEPEEFATPSPVKIDADSKPVAFGSLMGEPETETEDETAFESKTASIEHDWKAKGADAEEEIEEEETAAGGWRPGGDLDNNDLGVPTASGGGHDWREAAFHGNNPGRRPVTHWTPSAEKTAIVSEAAEETTTAVGVSTLEPVKAPEPVSTTPFSGDAWAAAMAAGVEEKAAAAEAEAAVAAESVVAESASISVPAISEPAVEEPKSFETAHEEVLPSYGAEPASVAEEIGAATASVEPESAFAQNSLAETVSEPVAAEETKPLETSSWYSAPPPTSPWDVEAKKVAELASTWDAPVTKGPDETQEITPYEAAKLAEATAVATQNQLNAQAEAIHETIAAAATSETVSSEAQQATPSMDDIVARVLQKMNPDVLQRVTQEILKPIVEAIVKDELESKKK